MKTKETKHKCPTCHGTKVINTTVTTVGSKEPPEHYELECVVCDGKGWLTDEEKQANEDYENAWCKCGNEKGSYFTGDDGDCNCGIYKHHYHCRLCDGVTQIGRKEQK